MVAGSIHTNDAIIISINVLYHMWLFQAKPSASGRALPPKVLSASGVAIHSLPSHILE